MGYITFIKPLKIFTIDKLCPWLTSTDKHDELECIDGSICNVETNEQKWSCCTDKHERRRKCPKNYPVMCADQVCGYNNTDYCCETANGCTEQYGGMRECKGMLDSHLQISLIFLFAC